MGTLLDWRTDVSLSEPVVLATHFVGKLIQFGRDFVLVPGLNERHLTTAAEQIPRDLHTANQQVINRWAAAPPGSTFPALTLLPATAKFWAVKKLSEKNFLSQNFCLKLPNLRPKISILRQFKGNIETLNTHNLLCVIPYGRWCSVALRWVFYKNLYHLAIQSVINLLWKWLCAFVWLDDRSLDVNFSLNEFRHVVFNIVHQIHLLTTQCTK